MILKTNNTSIEEDKWLKEIDDLQAAMSRPFGVAMLFAGCDQEGPKLYHLDPSGTYVEAKAKAIGAASDGAEQNLKEQYHDVRPQYNSLSEEG